MPITASIVLRYTILITSIILVILSIVSLALTGHAVQTMATLFPPDRYSWWFSMGNSNPQVMQHMVRLAYNWTTENLVFATSGLSIVAGCLCMIGFVLNKAWKTEEGRKLPSSTAYFVGLVLAFAAFGTALASNIWIAVYHAKVGNSTCTWRRGMTPDATLTCTRERAACNLLWYMTDRNQDERNQACFETQTTRMILRPLAVFAFILTAALAVQGYRDARARNSMVADQRVERLQEDN